ncbi:MAG TPA: hypothetical protein PLP33_16275 [Leptospiraceae bacterium]|nr:hypothetical protein [Leptospiraceae bacterium]
MIKKLKEEKKKDVQTIPVVSTKASTLPQDMSLDQKVDRYLIQYERESIPQSQMFAGLDNTPRPSIPNAIAQLKEYKLIRAIFEADEKDPDLDLGGEAGGPDDSAGGLDLGGDSSPSGGDAGENPAPAQPEVPEAMLNIQKFAANIARLVGNYDVMLDPKTVILNRVYVYLLKNYNEQTAKECMIVLNKYYQLTPNSKTMRSTQVGSSYFSAVGNLADGGSIPSGGGIGGGETGGI